MYGLSNGTNIFVLRWPLKVNGQSQTLKPFEVEYLKNGTR